MSSEEPKLEKIPVIKLTENCYTLYEKGDIESAEELLKDAKIPPDWQAVFQKKIDSVRSELKVLEKKEDIFDPILQRHIQRLEKAVADYKHDKVQYPIKVSERSEFIQSLKALYLILEDKTPQIKLTKDDKASLLIKVTG